MQAAGYLFFYLRVKVLWSSGTEQQYQHSRTKEVTFSKTDFLD